MCVNDRQWWNGVQQNPKPSDCDWANYRGIYALCSYSSDDLSMLFLFLTLFPIYFVLCIMPIIVFSVVSLLTCLIPQHSLVLMFSFSFKESQEREARQVDVFDFGKWVDASCKGNKIYHRGLLRGGEWKCCSFVTKDCLEDSFSLISLKPVPRCFHYKGFYVAVSFGKGLHLFWNKSKAPQVYCLVTLQRG